MIFFNGFQEIIISWSIWRIFKKNRLFVIFFNSVLKNNPVSSSKLSINRQLKGSGKFLIAQYIANLTVDTHRQKSNIINNACKSILFYFSFFKKIYLNVPFLKFWISINSAPFGFLNKPSGSTIIAKKKGENSIICIVQKKLNIWNKNYLDMASFWQYFERPYKFYCPDLETICKNINSFEKEISS